MSGQTANGVYRYDHELQGHTLDWWVQRTHQYNCQQNGWYHHPLKLGAFGYDNLCMSLGRLLEMDLKTMDEWHAADIIHRGWTENYLYWRDNQPWKSNSSYVKPSRPLADTRRDMCAQNQFEDLPSDEQQKDIILAQFVLKELEK